MSASGEITSRRAPTASQGLAFRPLGGGALPTLPTPAEAPVEAEGERDDLLAAEIAHDFNNLLSVILACACELETEAAAPMVRERACEIRSAAQQGALLTKALTERARRSETESTPSDVNLVLAQAEGLLARAAGDGVSLRLELGRDLPRTVVAGERLEGVVLNLVANAREAMGGVGRLRVSTRLATVPAGEGGLGPGWYVELEVADDGPGMSDAVRARALDPFYTTRPGSGTGLGLAAVARFAREAGGDVRITGAPGAGTTVSVLLPAAGRGGVPLALRRT